MNFFLNHPRKRVFRNVNLSNLENVLQRNLRTGKARELFFRVSEGTSFENFSVWRANHSSAFVDSMLYRSSQKSSGDVTDYRYLGSEYTSGISTTSEHQTIAVQLWKLIH